MPKQDPYEQLARLKRNKATLESNLQKANRCGDNYKCILKTLEETVKEITRIEIELNTLERKKAK